MKKFCPSCGKRTDRLTENLCFRCFSRNLKIMKIPRVINVKLCRCNRLLNKGKWIFFKSFDELIEHAVYKNIKIFKGTFVSIDYKKGDINKTVTPLELKGELNFDGRKLIEHGHTELRLFPKLCVGCSRISGGYYEAIIQLRTNRNKKIQEFIDDKIKSFNKNDWLSFITKTEKIGKGMDIYIGSKKTAIKIVNEARKIYNLKIKKSYKLKGMKDGKKQYQTSFSLKDK